MSNTFILSELKGEGSLFVLPDHKVVFPFFVDKWSADEVYFKELNPETCTPNINSNVSQRSLFISHLSQSLKHQATRYKLAQHYLQNHHVATLATCDSEGPWAAAVFYACEHDTLYFLSSPTSRHCLNLTQNQRVAVTIQEDYSDWLEIKGVQIEGIASEISGSEEAKARKLYGNKFPVVGLLAQAPAAIVKALAKVRWYKIVPQRLYFIDNSLGLGNRDEIILPPSGCDDGADP